MVRYSSSSSHIIAAKLTTSSINENNSLKREGNQLDSGISQKKVKGNGGFSLKDRLIKGFQDRGLTAQDLTSAIVIHEALGIFMLALTWSFCYFVQISTLPVLQKPLAKIASIMPNVIASNEFLNSRLGVAYCESSCLRKLIRPFTLPMKLIVTVKLVQILQHLRPKNSKSSDNFSIAASIDEKPALKPVADYFELSSASNMKTIKLGNSLLSQRLVQKPVFTISF